MFELFDVFKECVVFSSVSLCFDDIVRVCCRVCVCCLVLCLVLGV